MAFSIPGKQVIAYPPKRLLAFEAYVFEWIDNLHFLLDPGEFIEGDAAPYLAIAAQRFRQQGWDGDGTIQLLWLPPFAFPRHADVGTEGVVLWHVKQLKDGLSFLLSPLPLPFEEFAA